MEQTTIPYTYLIKNKTTGLFYYGVRIANGCNPKDLWVKYFTSSKHVKNAIKQYGVEDFEVEIRKIFMSKEQATKHEHKVLTRLKAHKRKDFMNKCAYPLITCDEPFKLIHNIKTGRMKHLLTNEPLPEGWKYGYHDTYNNNSHITRLFYNNGTIEKRFSVDEEIPANFVRGRIKNILKWITDGNIIKRLHKDEPLPEGFVYGRCDINHLKQYYYEKDRKSDICPARNTRWVTDGKTEMKIEKDTIPPEGFKFGRIKENYNNRERFTGTHCYTDGYKVIKLKDDEVVPEGFYRGGKVVKS